ncbi:MAG: hypothetical protein ABI337_04125 [Nitrososphaera sp.]|jgi:molecular chaperone DnaK (HSP70)
MSLERIGAAINIYNSWTDLKQKEFNSIISSTFEKAEYYYQHPEEKEAIIKNAIELLEEWKKKRKEYLEYHKWCEGRKYSEDEFNKDLELLDIQTRKFKTFVFYCMNHPIQEILGVMINAQKILGENNELS